MFRQIGVPGALVVVCLGCARERPPEETYVPVTTAPRAVRSAASREAEITKALARAPQLNRATAELLLDDVDRRESTWGDAADVSLVASSHGFAQMSPDELRELVGLFDQVFGSFSPADRTRVEGYVERVRRGDATAADEQARTLLAQGVNALPPARRERLQALLETAVRAALDSQRRTSLTARMPTPPPTPYRPPQPWDTAQNAPKQNDAYFRQQRETESALAKAESEDAQMRAAGAQYGAQLAQLEEQVRYAERGVESARQGLARAKDVPLKNRTLADESVVAAERQVAEAEESLRQARNRLDDLETRVRRERIPQSYLQR